VPVPKSLSFAALPKAEADPLQLHRAKFVTKLEEQAPPEGRQKDNLPAVIDTLLSAVRAGELDELFSQAVRTASIGTTRKSSLIERPGDD
jgi:hypothetical protein